QAVGRVGKCAPPPLLRGGVCRRHCPPAGQAKPPAAAATSVPAPSLPAGTRARIASRCLSLSLSVMAVAMKPGAIAFAVTPRLAYSAAIDLIMPIMPALLAV